MNSAASELAFRAQLVIPEQRELYDYWRSRSNNGIPPSRKDISPTHFPRLLPSISLIDVEPSSRRFKVRLAGTRLRDIYEREITGAYLDELDWGERTEYWRQAYQRVVDVGCPTQGVIRGPRESKEHLVQFWLRLPLSNDGSHVTMILCYDAFVPAAEMVGVHGGRFGETPQYGLRA